MSGLEKQINEGDSQERASSGANDLKFSNNLRLSKSNVSPSRSRLSKLGMVATVPLLAGCDYREAVLQNIGWGISDCVNEAGAYGCLIGGSVFELLSGALINGALYGYQ